MQSVVEYLSDLSRKIKITVPSNEFKNEFNKKTNELAKSANIKGFRKGKVPASVIKLQYGDEIKEEILQELISKTFKQVLEEKKIYPAGMPKIDIINSKDGEPLEYEALFEVFPEVKLDLEGLSVEKLNAKIDEAQVEDVINKLRVQNTKWNTVEKPAGENNLVVIDFEGYIDEALFEGGSAKNFRLELGKKAMIPGFEEPIYGASAGDEIEVQVTFPEDYHAKEYAGKPAKFLITIHEVMEGELPELNDDFAKDLGVSDGTISGLNNEVRENLERELTRRIHEKVKAELIEKVLEKNSVELPRAPIEEEIKRILKTMQKQFAARTGSKNLMPNLPSSEELEEQAKKNVTLGLLLSQWIEDNEIKVDANRVKDRIEQIASSYHHPHEITNWYFNNKEALSEIEAAILEEQAIEKILDKIHVIEKEVTFDEIMNVGEMKKNV